MPAQVPQALHDGLSEMKQRVSDERARGGQAGGAEGVEASICMRATLQFSRGLPMHCLPRAA